MTEEEERNLKKRIDNDLKEEQKAPLEIKTNNFSETDGTVRHNTAHESKEQTAGSKQTSTTSESKSTNSRILDIIENSNTTSSKISRKSSNSAEA